MPTLADIRRQFPSLASPTVFFENAGGSQVPRVVADRIRDYMLSSYANYGAGYRESRQATRLLADAHDFVNLLFNGVDHGKAIIGASSSQLLRMLSECYAEVLKPGDAVVVAETNHEANAGPWTRLARLGVAVHLWKVDPASWQCPLDELERLLRRGGVRLVAFPHVSNVLGYTADARSIIGLAHRHGARVVVDGVAYASHHAIDVAALQADWYVYSTYKVYGPHQAALFGRSDAMAELTGPNHFFVKTGDHPKKFELGAICHEACAGILALGDYLKFLAEAPPDAPVDRAIVERAFGIMPRFEQPLLARLLAFLSTKPAVRVIGPAEPIPGRVGTVSFVHATLRSAEIARAANDAGIGIRNGHCASHRLCSALGLDPDDGVVRASFVHYNTPQEMESLIEVLERVL